MALNSGYVPRKHVKNYDAQGQQKDIYIQKVDHNTIILFISSTLWFLEDLKDI
jgi:hypothetical protein